MIEYAIFAYDQDPIKIARAPQGSASAEEQAKLDALAEKVRQLGDIFDDLFAKQLSLFEDSLYNLF